MYFSKFSFRMDVIILDIFCILCSMEMGKFHTKMELLLMENSFMEFLVVGLVRISKTNLLIDIAFFKSLYLIDICTFFLTNHQRNLQLWQVHETFPQFAFNLHWWKAILCLVISKLTKIFFKSANFETKTHTKM